jgi:hypothetical protein
VQGAYLIGNNDVEDFTGLNVDAVDPSLAHYNFGRQPVGHYQLRVGCGGTRETWALNIPTEVVSGPTANFVCHDRQNDPIFLQCTLAGT